MKTCLPVLLALAVWVSFFSFFPSHASEKPAPKPRPVFPGAEGFGAHTRAGRGGTIIKVTNLNAEGAGSLRAAIEAKGPRTVVFEVAGVMDLGKNVLSIREPFLTLAGQTAPSPGITLIGSGIKVETHDVLIRHLHVRPGDKGGQGWEPDGISIGSYQGREVYNVVLDHCSFTWAIDENASVSGKKPAPHDVTYSNCIIAEGLSRATHAKGEHSKGTLIHNGCRNIALIRNLYANNFRRNPYSKEGTSIVVLNNLIVNPGQLGIHISNFGGRTPLASIVGNVFVAGGNTPPGLGLLSTMGGAPRVYLHDNLARNANGAQRTLLTKGGSGQVRKWNARVQRVAEKPVWFQQATVLPAQEVMPYVLKSSGARPADRDGVDQRIVREIRQNKGKIIDSQKQVGGYPKLKPVHRKLKVPNEPQGDKDKDGYTNLEEWLHGLADRVEGRGK